MDSKYEVVISLRDPRTGAAVATKAHPAADSLAAASLVGNIQECIEQISEYLPGLRVEVYELAETWRPTTRGEALLERLAEAARAGEVHSAQEWARVIQDMPA